MHDRVDDAWYRRINHACDNFIKRILFHKFYAGTINPE